MADDLLYNRGTLPGRISAVASASGQRDAVNPWAAVDALIDRAPDFDALLAHRLHLLAARRWRGQGRPLPSWLTDAERAASLTTMMATLVLERIRNDYDGRIVLFKGLEVAQSYPSPSLRPFVDIDLLVDDSERAQAALIAAGFEEVGDPLLYLDIHHLRPLAAPGLPLAVEIHHEPKWPDRIDTKPPLAELLGAAVPSATGVDGIEALSPAHHSVILAAHAWAHEPLQCLSELLDFHIVVAGSENEARTTATRWGLHKIVDVTLQTADHLFAGNRLPAGLVYARHLEQARERTVVESHLAKWLAPLYELQGHARFRAVAQAVIDDARPWPGEGWAAKGRRILAAVRRARVARRVHDELLGDQAHVGRVGSGGSGAEKLKEPPES
jgi:hypothetical protein